MPDVFTVFLNKDDDDDDDLHHTVTREHQTCVQSPHPSPSPPPKKSK